MPQWRRQAQIARIGLPSNLVEITEPRPPTSAPPPERGPTSPSAATPHANLFGELKRRKVYRVGAAYLAVVFAVLQGADLVLPALGIGGRAFNALVLVSLAGFPLTMALAWMFDITGEGIRRTSSADAQAGAAAPDRWGYIKAALVGAGFVGVVWTGVGLWQHGPAGREEYLIPRARPVLAVLPFNDYSPGQDQAYFADGLHEELLHQLAALKGIELISRTSTDHFRGSPSKVTAIADSLGAGYVLEGSVRRTVDSVRVTAQLIDGKTDQHLWSESYSEPMTMEGIFTLQEGLAVRLGRSLGATLATGDAQLVGGLPTRSADAYNAYLLGLYDAHKFTIEGDLAALDDFKRAVALDSRFGRAWGMLGLQYVLVPNQGNPTVDSDSMFAAARRAADRALELAPNEVESHMAQVAVHWTLEWDWDAAHEELLEVLKLNPDLVDAHAYMAQYWWLIVGDTEKALREVDVAIRLDPLAILPRWSRGAALMTGGRFDEGVAAFREAHRMAPDNPMFTTMLAGALAFTGHREESTALDSLWVPYWPRPLAPGWASIFAEQGDTAYARALLDTALVAYREGRMRASMGFAELYVALGEYDEALTWLERAVGEERFYSLRDPGFAPLAKEPRFQALWEKVHLPGKPTDILPGSNTPPSG